MPYSMMMNQYWLLWSIIKKYRRDIWSKFIRAINDYKLIEDNDETHMERFNTLVEDLRSQGFDPAYCPDETVFYISFENIAEIILKEYP